MGKFELPWELVCDLELGFVSDFRFEYRLEFI